MAQDEERKTGWQTDRQTDRQVERQIGRQAESEKEKTQHAENVIYRHKREVQNVKAHAKKKKEEKSHTCTYYITELTPHHTQRAAPYRKSHEKKVSLFTWSSYQ